MRTTRFFSSCVVAASVGLVVGAVLAADAPQWGERHTRNMVSRERGLPASFDPQTGRNVKWVAALGTETHSTPIVAGGRVFIGTNNGAPRDPLQQGDFGVLMCFDEASGEFLWQIAVPKIAEDPYMDWPGTGLSSPVTVEDNRLYLLNNRAEVVCLDARGRGAPKELWRYDLVAGAGIWPHDAAHSSILVYGRHLYLNTGNGVDNTHRKIRRPDAPSLVVLDKATGRLRARDGEGIGPNIFHCTWSSPSLGRMGGRPRLFFAGGNGVVYAFETLGRVSGAEPAILRKVWEFAFDPDAPKENVHRYTSNRREGPSNIYGMPVFHRRRLYVAGGGDAFWGKNAAWLKCISATDGIELWSYPLGHHTLSTPAVWEGMVFVTDTQHQIHCVDAETGRGIWTHDAKGEMWASPLVADGKVYVGTRRGDFWVLAASRQKRVLHHVNLGGAISATATAANGALYVASMSKLYAFGASQK